MKSPSSQVGIEWAPIREVDGHGAVCIYVVKLIALDLQLCQWVNEEY